MKTTRTNPVNSTVNVTRPLCSLFLALCVITLSSSCNDKVQQPGERYVPCDRDDVPVVSAPFSLCVARDNCDLVCPEESVQKEEPLRTWCDMEGKEHGPYVIWSSEDVKDREGTYQSGKKHGLEVTYKNQKIHSTTEFENGIKHGASKEYEGELIVLEDNWHRGVRHGKYTRWFNNGQMRCTGDFHLDLPRGPWTFWYPNGRKFSEGNLLDEYFTDELKCWSVEGTPEPCDLTDDAHFLWPVITPDAVVECEATPTGATCPAAVADGLFTRQDASGHEVIRGQYENGLRTHTWKFWQANGTQVETTYVDGLLNGTMIFYKNGKETLKQQFQDGLIHGKTSSYHDNGQLYEDMEYSHGERVAQNRVFDDTGKPIVIGQFRQNEQDGTWTMWNRLSKTKDSEVEYRVLHHSSTKHGREIAWFRNGNKQLEGDNWHGEQRGVWTQWYNEGQRFWECEYRDGRRSGPCIYWYDNGQIGQQGEYRDGMKVGEWAFRHDNGVVETSGYFVADMKFGVWTTWYDNGQMKRRGEYRDSPCGTHECWNREGEVAFCEQSFGCETTPLGERCPPCSGDQIDGKKHGVWVTTDADGRKIRQATFDNGVEHGEFHEWHENGSEKSRGHFLHGERHGEWSEWYPDGRLRSQGSYRRADKAGKWTTCDRSGLCATGEYKDDNRDGKWTSLALDGTTRSEGQYCDGRPVDTHKCWDETANPTECKLDDYWVRELYCHRTPTGAECAPCRVQR